MRPLVAFVCTFALAVALAACGGDDDASSVDASPIDASAADVVPGADARFDAAPIDARLPDAAVSPFVCDPVHQTGCGAGQKCDLAASGTFACVAGGSLGDFRVCDPARPNACAAGFTCRDTSFGDHRCARLCTVAEEDDLCRSNEPCTSVRTTSDGHEYLMCKSPNACNPVLDDCGDAAKTCAWTSIISACLAPGTVADGGACDSPAKCRRGSACLPTGPGQSRCFEVCDPDAAAPGCAAAAACTFFGTTGPQRVGACGYTLP
jgi:hypothetical protein